MTSRLKGLSRSLRNGRLQMMAGLLSVGLGADLSAADIQTGDSILVSQQPELVRSSQTKPSISIQGKNGYVVWQDGAIDGKGFGIAMRSIGESGVKSQTPTRVNDVTVYNQEAPAVSTFPDGGALIVWQGGRRGQQDIFGRILTAKGSWAGDQFFVNVNRSGQQQSPAVATDGSGSSLVVWENAVFAGRAIHGQRIDSSGKRVGGEITISAVGSIENYAPRVTSAGPGQYAVLWSASSRGYHLSGKIAQRGQQSLIVRAYNSAGLPLGDETVAAQGFFGIRGSAITSTGDSLVVAWTESAIKNGLTKAKAARFSLMGQPLGNTVELGEGTSVVGEISVAASGSEHMFAYTTRDESGFPTVSLQTWMQDSDVPGEVSTMNDGASIRRSNPVVETFGSGHWLLWSQYSGTTAFDIYALSLP